MNTIAICFYGSLGTKNKYATGPNNIDPCVYINSYKNYLIKENCDIYIHAWDSPDVNNVIEILKPKKYLIEKKRFFVSWSQLNIIFKKYKYDINFYLGLFCASSFKLSPVLIRISSILSRWYSTKKSLSLVDGNINYSHIVFIRLDLVLKKQFDPSLYCNGNLICCGPFNEYFTGERFKLTSIDYGIEYGKLNDIIFGIPFNKTKMLDDMFSSVKNSSKPLSPHQSLHSAFKSDFCNINIVEHIPGVDWVVGRDVS